MFLHFCVYDCACLFLCIFFGCIKGKFVSDNVQYNRGVFARVLVGVCLVCLSVYVLFMHECMYVRECGRFANQN